MDLLNKIGVSPVKLQQMEEAGLDVIAVKTGLKFVKNGETLGNLPLAASILASLQEGSASALTKKAVNESLSVVLGQLLAQAKTGGSVLHAKVEKGVTPADLVVEGPVVKKTASGGGADTWGTYPLGDMMLGKKVPLIEATQLYQPVNGSDSGSRYFCLGLSKNLKVGVRWQGGKMSVRFEGLGLGSYMDNLCAAGLQNHGNYASLHLEVHDVVTARKTFGALMMASTCLWETEATDISLIQGKGA